MNVREHVALRDITWYQLGGSARYVLEVFSKEDVFLALEFIKEKQITKHVVMGLGSNLIFPDSGFDGAVIQMKWAEDQPQIRLVHNHTIEAFAGHLLDDVIQFGFAHHLIGMSWAGGLPGTVGAGVRGNVGAFGGDIEKVFEKAEVVEAGKGHDVRDLAIDTMDFAYRTSVVKTHGSYIILSATFTMQEANHVDLEAAKQQYEDCIAYRKTHHPLEFPSCGSTFKNIKAKQDVQKVLDVFPDIAPLVQDKWHGKVSMGYIINRLGLSGYQVGHAQISPKHPNFIVNLGGATSSDVLAIIDKIVLICNQRFGFSPEPEVGIIQ